MRGSVKLKLSDLGESVARGNRGFARRAKNVPQDIDIVIVEHIDPEHLLPGGIDTIVHDIVGFSPAVRFAIVGVSHGTSSTIGQWRPIDFAGRTIPFLQVSALDRSARVNGPRIPHSMLMALGLLRYRRLIPRTLMHAHRIETGALLILIGRKTVVQFIHNDSNGLLGTNSDSVWRHLAWAYRLLERFVLNRASGVAIFNETDGQRIKAIRPDLVITKTWFDPSVFFPQKLRQHQDDRLRVCWVGRLECQKDPMLAIDVLNELIGIIPTASLRLAGTGALEEQVREHASSLGISEHVEFLGALSRPEVAGLMTTSSVLLLTSHYEGSPTVLVEAAATGLPVVATAQADPDLALVRHTNGIAVDGRDPLDLAKALAEARLYSRAACQQSAQSRSAVILVPRLTNIGRTHAPKK